MSAELHATLVCTGIVAGVLAVIAIGCSVAWACAALVDRHVDVALSAPTERAISEALSIANGPADNDRLQQAVAAFNAAQDELATRRSKRCL